MGKTLNVFCASGGGSKGAFEGGVLEALTEEGIELHAFVGVSTGSIQAGFMSLAGAGIEAQRDQVAGLKQLWFGLDGDSAIYSKPALGVVGIIAKLLLGRPSIYTFGPFKALLSRYVTTGPQREVRLGIVELWSSHFVALRPTCAEELRSGILASCSIPVFFPPVAPDRVDGGVRNIAPLPTAFDLARDLLEQDPNGTWDGVTMYVALASPRDIAFDNQRWSKERLWTIGLRSLEILEGDNFEADIKSTLETNDLIGYFERHPTYEKPPALEGKIFATIYLFEPDSIPYSALEFDRTKIEDFWRQGYEKAKAELRTGPLKRVGRRH